MRHKTDPACSWTCFKEHKIHAYFCHNYSRNPEYPEN